MESYSHNTKPILYVQPFITPLLLKIAQVVILRENYHKQKRKTTEKDKIQMHNYYSIIMKGNKTGATTFLPFYNITKRKQYQMQHGTS